MKRPKKIHNMCWRTYINPRAFVITNMIITYIISQAFVIIKYSYNIHIRRQPPSIIDFT